MLSILDSTRSLRRAPGIPRTRSLRAAFLLAAWVLSSCATTTTGRPHVQVSPTASRQVQLQACEALSGVMTAGRNMDQMKVSSAEVPAPLRVTGFGTPDAECAADPALGIYYTGLVWNRTVPRATITAFVGRLKRSGFVDRASIGSAIALRPPVGVSAVINGQRQQMDSVQVDSPAGGSLTYVMWV